MTRPLDQLGRIVLPKELRSTMDIRMGDSLELFIGKDSIMLRKYNGRTCRLCGSIDHLSYYRDTMVCTVCIQELKQQTPPAPATTESEYVFDIKKKAPYTSTNVMLKQLRAIMEKHPNARQKKWAELLGVSQGRVSQLKKLL